MPKFLNTLFKFTSFWNLIQYIIINFMFNN